jgi:hypothetical protein
LAQIPLFLRRRSVLSPDKELPPLKDVREIKKAGNGEVCCRLPPVLEQMFLPVVPIADLGKSDEKVVAKTDLWKAFINSHNTLLVSRKTSRRMTNSGGHSVQYPHGMKGIVSNNNCDKSLSV